MSDELYFDGYSNDEDVGNAGGLEIMGAVGHALEILGATPTQVASIKKNPAFISRVASQLARVKPIMQSTPITKKRVWPIGFGPTAIPPAQSVVATANPQVYFLGRKLINTGDETNLFLTQITVGNQQQLPANTNPISVRAFSKDVLENAMKFDTCQPALTMSLTVANLGSTTATWHMVLFGTAAQ